MTRPRVGISRCLLGDAVRYDGRDKLESSLIDTLGAHVDWVPVCPEVETGMGVPREPVRLIVLAPEPQGAVGQVRMVGGETGRDWTDAMRAWVRRRIEELAALDLSGFVLKARSPSCGPRDVPIHHASGAAVTGRGLFAEALLAAFPDIAVEDEERLRDATVRQSFLERVLARARGS